MNKEIGRRNALTAELEFVVDGWKAFAEEFHGKEYTDGEHAFGVMIVEFQEALDRVEAVGNVIKEFKEKQVMNHTYQDTPKQMAALYDHARFAAEEFAQLAAVAQKTMQSGFVKECDRE